MKNYFFLLIGFIVVGCSVISSERVLCPKTAILAEFSKTIDFQKGIPIRTEMDSLHPLCERNGDKIHVNLRLRLTSLRPLLSFRTPAKINPSYFVAVVSKEGNVLSRTNHKIDIAFDETQTTKVSFQRIQEVVPLDGDVSIYVGFNLDEEQFEFLKKERDMKMHDQRS